MKKIFFLIILFSLFFNSTRQAEAQNLSSKETTEAAFDSSELPQWVKDFRRFDIITFGAFPFSIFFVTFAEDMIRWNDANGLDFSEQGRQYAPWPLKSAGAYEMTNDEYTKTIWLAVGVSAAVALVDLIIVTIKRANERRRIESRPSGSYEIIKTPYGTPLADDSPVVETGENTAENNDDSVKTGED
jgi:hypothetical protein